MDGSSNDQRHEIRREGDTWHVVKGIPIAVIITFIVQTLSLIAVGAWGARGFVSGQEKFAAELIVLSGKVNDLTTRVDKLSEILANSNVPTAINARRIEDLERRANQSEATINALTARVVENERRLSTEALRNRARGER